MAQKGPGGAEALLVGHAKVRDRERFSYEVAYLLPWKQHLVAALRDQDVSSHCLEGPREWAWRLRCLLRSRSFDVMHMHSPYPSTIARLVSRTLPRRYRPALIHTEHNEWRRHTLVTRLGNRVTSPMDTSHLAVSEGVRNSLPRRLRNRTETLRCGIDLDEVRRCKDLRTKVRAELRVGPDTVLIGTIANLRTEKAYPHLLLAAKRVVTTQPSTRFVSVGQGPMEEALQRQHRQLGLGDAFQFLGYRSDAKRILAAFDIFVLSSLHEGLPLSLMEALAIGLPVVATAVGGIPEAIRHVVEGFLVPPGCPELLADALLALVLDERERTVFGEAAARRSKQFDVTSMARKLEQAYELAASGPDMPA